MKIEVILVFCSLFIIGLITFSVSSQSYGYSGYGYDYSDYSYGYSCEYSAWSYGSCGVSCSSTERQQTREVTQGDTAYCTEISQCLSDSSCGYGYSSTGYDEGAYGSTGQTGQTGQTGTSGGGYGYGYGYGTCPICDRYCNGESGDVTGEDKTWGWPAVVHVANPLDAMSKANEKAALAADAACTEEYKKRTGKDKWDCPKATDAQVCKNDQGKVIGAVCCRTIIDNKILKADVKPGENYNKCQAAGETMSGTVTSKGSRTSILTLGKEFDSAWNSDSGIKEKVDKCEKAKCGAVVTFGQAKVVVEYHQEWEGVIQKDVYWVEVTLPYTVQCVDMLNKKMPDSYIATVNVHETALCVKWRDAVAGTIYGWNCPAIDEPSTRANSK